MPDGVWIVWAGGLSLVAEANRIVVVQMAQVAANARKLGVAAAIVSNHWMKTQICEQKHLSAQ